METKIAFYTSEKRQEQQNKPQQNFLSLWNMLKSTKTVKIVMEHMSSQLQELHNRIIYVRRHEKSARKDRNKLTGQ